MPPLLLKGKLEVNVTQPYVSSRKNFGDIMQNIKEKHPPQRTQRAQNRGVLLNHRNRNRYRYRNRPAQGHTHRCAPTFNINVKLLKDGIAHFFYDFLCELCALCGENKNGDR